MHEMRYFVPSNHPSVDGSLDMDVIRMAASIKGVDRKSVNVPNTALWIQLIILADGASLEIKKHKKLVYINLFCFEVLQTDSVFLTVNSLYKRYSLGTPKRPLQPTWIHSIPVSTSLLRENEFQLCHNLTVAYYWAVYRQLLNERNPLN